MDLKRITTIGGGYPFAVGRRGRVMALLLLPLRALLATPTVMLLFVPVIIGVARAQRRARLGGRGRARVPRARLPLRPALLPPDGRVAGRVARPGRLPRRGARVRAADRAAARSASARRCSRQRSSSCSTGCRSGSRPRSRARLDRRVHRGAGHRGSRRAARRRSTLAGPAPAPPTCLAQAGTRERPRGEAALVAWVLRHRARPSACRRPTACPTTSAWSRSAPPTRSRASSPTACTCRCRRRRASRACSSPSSQPRRRHEPTTRGSSPPSRTSPRPRSSGSASRRRPRTPRRCARPTGSRRRSCQLGVARAQDAAGCRDRARHRPHRGGRELRCGARPRGARRRRRGPRRASTPPSATCSTSRGSSPTRGSRTSRLHDVRDILGTVLVAPARGAARPRALRRSPRTCRDVVRRLRPAGAGALEPRRERARVLACRTRR